MAFLDASIAHGELFLAELDGVLTGCMVLNRAYNDGYAAVTWAAAVPDAQLLVIHALGVHPAFARWGIAQRMVQYAIGTARSQGCRALRTAAHCGSTCWAATSRPSGSTSGRALPAVARCGCFMTTPAGRTTASMNTCCERAEKSGCGIPQPVFACWCAQYALIGSESSSCPFSTERMTMS